MRILTSEQMREVDRLTTERYAIPGILLMENAAARAAEAIERDFGSLANLRVKILCGKGNNGGDGAAVARQLWLRGAAVDVVLLGRVEATRGDALVNFEAARALAGAGDRLSFREAETVEALWEDVGVGEPDLYVDAIFGTGLARPAEGLYAEAIEMLNARATARLVALDLPSGLASDTPEPIGPHVRADLTVTFTAPKPACALPPALFACGRVVVGHIGTPAELVDASGSRLSLVTAEGVAEWLAVSRRQPDAHKGSVGSVLVVAGGAGKTGAAAMTAEAALRGGAGLVTIATAHSAEAALAARAVPEAMTEPLAETPDGALSLAALDALRRLVSGRTVAAVGPGIGTDPSTKALVRALVAERERPMVLDADALNCLAPWPDELAGSVELPLVLTPHPAEMARLSGTETRVVVADRVAAARDFAVRHGVVVALKGARTVVAEPGGEVFVNPTGNAGMATGGSGDVLTGIVAALVGQRPSDALGAALAGVYLHGLAGDLAARETGARALVATDITRALGRAFVEAGGPDELP
jgi:NAD(P)H-hydrate epimerase